MKIVKPKDFKKFAINVFQKIKVNSKIYMPIINNLVNTSLRGVDSHGIRLFYLYIKSAMSGRINTRPDFKFKKIKPSAGILDADHTWGITAGLMAVDKGMELADKTGISCIAVKNSSHFGACAIYGLHGANKGYITICFSQAESQVLPHGGRKKIFGTNPLCFCAPMAGESPFCLDMSTSVIPFNKVLNSIEKGASLEPGMAADKNGKETLDPNKAYGLFPIGKYKGYGLAMMVEILCSILTGMEFDTNITKLFPVTGEKRDLGHFFILIKISSYMSLANFKKRLGKLAYLLRHQIPITNKEPVLVAGDPEKISCKERMKSGIPITRSEYCSFMELAKDLNVDINF